MPLRAEYQDYGMPHALPHVESVTVPTSGAQLASGNGSAALPSGSAPEPKPEAVTQPEPALPASSGSASSYSEGYKDGRESMRRKLTALQWELQRLKEVKQKITPDQCADFLLRRAETALEGARIMLGIEKSEMQNGLK